MGGKGWCGWGTGQDSWRQCMGREDLRHRRDEAVQRMGGGVRREWEELGEGCIPWAEGGCGVLVVKSGGYHGVTRAGIPQWASRNAGTWAVRGRVCISVLAAKLGELPAPFINIPLPSQSPRRPSPPRRPHPPSHRPRRRHSRLHQHVCQRCCTPPAMPLFTPPLRPASTLKHKPMRGLTHALMHTHTHTVPPKHISPSILPPRS